eukprot:3644519-Rhodomonas_salina.1
MATLVPSRTTTMASPEPPGRMGRDGGCGAGSGRGTAGTPPPARAPAPPRPRRVKLRWWGGLHRGSSRVGWF